MDRADNLGHGIVQRQGLAESERAAAEELKALCDNLEGLDLAINLAPVGSPAARETRQFLDVDHDRLRGFLSADGWPEPEVCLMVHPDQRRKGIGSALLAAAGEEARGRGGSSFLLVAEDASRSGRAFVAAQGATYRYSEYRMKLDAAKARAAQRLGPLRLRQATPADVGTIGRVVGAAFGDSEEPHRRKTERELGRPHVRYYLGELAGEPVGSLRLVWMEGRVYVTAFGVLPALQGRGYGRQILSETIAALLAEGQDEIYIEVETNNRNALGLYRSCGFEETTAYGFYSLAL